MKCDVISLDKKQAENGNWYVNIVAQPSDDPWSEELKYRMWCTEALAEKLVSNPPEHIELQKVCVDVQPYNRVDDSGIVEETVFTRLTVTCRLHKDEMIDNADAMAAKLRKQLLNDGKIADVAVDEFAGAIGDLPE